MKLVKYQGRLPVCVEGFPEDAERVKGHTSLHLRPGQTVTLTDDEYAFIKANRSDLAKSLIVLRDNVPAPKKEEKAEEAVEKSADEPAAEPSEDSDEEQL